MIALGIWILVILSGLNLINNYQIYLFQKKIDDKNR